MVITAKFSSNCPNCRQPITVGARVEWSRGSAARHTVCPETPVEREARYAAPASYCEHPQFHRSDCVCAKPMPIGTDADDRSYDAWVAFQASQPVAHLSVEDAGVYVLPDGAIVKVQANREKTRTYAKRWTVIGGTRLSEADTREHGEYVFEPGLIAQVEREGRKMSLDEAKAFILRYGVCARCGRGLKDATSVERGIGPVCIKYFSEGTTGADVLTSRQQQVEAFLARKGFGKSDERRVNGAEFAEAILTKDYTVSRWSRANDDDLSAAAGYGRDEDY